MTRLPKTDITKRSPARSLRRGATAACALVVTLMLVSTLPLRAGTWASIPPGVLGASVGLCNPILVTDGTVIAHDCGVSNLTSNWYRLTPDKHGSYENGTWSNFASLPSGYGPEWFASAVLPDGRVLVEGGEDNITGCSTTGQVWTSRGAIYDPAHPLLGWVSVSPPGGAGWTNTTPCASSPTSTGGIGDAPSVVLPNKTFMMGACCAYPDLDALFDAVTKTWSSTGAPTSPCPSSCPTGVAPGTPYQQEQGYTLLATDKVLTISVWDPPNAEVYDEKTGTWSLVSPTPVTLPDTCGSNEIGPAITRHDGSVVAFGGNLCAGKPDPTAIYDPATDTWTKGPNLPKQCGPAKTNYCTAADTPAAMLPNGNILFTASGVSQNNPPVQFYEFTGAASLTPNKIDKVASAAGAGTVKASGYYHLLVLPSGNVLATDITNVAQIYTPSSGGTDRDWAPTVSSAPSCVVPGDTYVLKGNQLNGRSQGVNFGDDLQGATNFPLIRIIQGTDITYARTFGFSTMSIASGKAGSTSFTVSPATPLGLSELQVVANGLHSPSRSVDVALKCPGNGG